LRCLGKCHVDLLRERPGESPDYLDLLTVVKRPYRVGAFELEGRRRPCRPSRQQRQGADYRQAPPPTAPAVRSVNQVANTLAHCRNVPSAWLTTIQEEPFGPVTQQYSSCESQL